MGGSHVRQCKLKDFLYIQIPCDIPDLSKADLEIHWFCVVLISVLCFAVFPLDVTTVWPSNLLRLATTVPTQNLIGKQEVHARQKRTMLKGFKLF